MENKRRFVICAGIVMLLLALIVTICLVENTDEPRLVKNAVAVYEEAVDRLSSQQNLRLNIAYDKSTAIGTQVFRERSTQTLTYENFGTEQMHGYMEQTLLIGDYGISITELYSDQTGYFTVDGSAFRGEMTAQDYIARYLPATPITPELYTQISGTTTRSQTVIEFHQGTAPEEWLTLADATDFASEGSAYLNREGNLIKTVYLLSYTQGNAKITLSATVEVERYETIILPENLDAYTPIAYLDGPKELEIACGHLLTANNATATYADTIACEAFGDIRKQNIDVVISNAAGWNAKVNTKVVLENTGKIGSASTTAKNEIFENGKYTAQYTGGQITEANVSAEDMHAYCQDILVATIMLPAYIADIKITEKDGLRRIDFTGNEEFAKMLSNDACNTLYQKPEILNDLSESYKTNSVTCYLTVDMISGLPTQSGFAYDGIYTISEIPYQLIYQADQSYNLLATQ